MLAQLPQTPAQERSVFGSFFGNLNGVAYGFSRFSKDFATPTPMAEIFFQRTLENALPNALFEGSAHETIEWIGQIDGPGFLWNYALIERVFQDKFQALKSLKQGHRPAFKWPDGDHSYQDLAPYIADSVVFQRLCNTITAQVLRNARKVQPPRFW